LVFFIIVVDFLTFSAIIRAFLFAMSLANAWYWLCFVTGFVSLLTSFSYFSKVASMSSSSFDLLGGAEITASTVGPK